MKENLNQSNISGWGGYPVKKANVIYPQNIKQIIHVIKTQNLK